MATDQVTKDTSERFFEAVRFHQFFNRSMVAGRMVALPNGVGGLLEPFVEQVSSYCHSIVLVGSHAIGEGDSDSDIDLIILSNTTKEADYIKRAVDDQKRWRDSRSLIDCKVYTLEEFQRAKSGPQNRYLWTCLKNGLLLHGEDIRDSVRLDPNQVSDSYWAIVQSIEDACLNLSRQTQYTGSSYILYEALGTTYFIDRHVLCSLKSGERKEQFIESILGNEFSVCRERYYWVSRHIRPDASETRMRIPMSADKRYGPNMYSRMHEKALKTLNLVKKKFGLIQRWTDRS